MIEQNPIRGVVQLRGFCISSVILFHLFPDFFLNYYIGVDLFFCLSGICLSRPLVMGGRYKPLKFLGRRFLRIVPALFVCCFFTWTLLPLFFFPWEIVEFKRYALSTLNFSIDMVLAKNLNYFGPDALINPFLHFWSVAVELKAYLMFAVLFFFVKKKFFNEFVFVLGIVSLAKFILNDLSEDYFDFFSKIWIFLLGFFIPLITKVRWRHDFQLFEILARLELKNYGLSLALLLLFLVSSYLDQKIFLIASVMIFAVLCEVCFCFKHDIGSIAGTLLAALGSWSFSLYLWHWPIYHCPKYFSIISKYCG